MPFSHLQAVDPMTNLSDTLGTPARTVDWKLNAGQQAAADGFFNFLFEKQGELCISGPGGTGKTYLMSYLIDKVLPQYLATTKLMGIAPEYDAVVMTATTNKAAEVLAQATTRPTETIHSCLALTVRDDYKTGASVLTKTHGWQVHHRKIIFVDESSMIDGSLLAMIREGTCNSKVVYVGDHCQLSPITEPVSPVYTQDLPFFELTEPMRTGDPDLQAINEQLRHTVKTGEFLPIRLVPGVIDHLDGPAMQAEIDATFATLNNDSRILAYTNRRVTAYADHIRELRRYTTTYVAGEHLVSNSAVQLTKTLRLSVEEELTVVRLADRTEHVEIEPGVTLEVVRADLRSGYNTYSDVRLPVDKAHFAALVDYYKKAKNWNRHFYLKQTFPDLRLRESATIHKSQGSTYDTVFIDLDDLSTCRNPNQAARLLYVGFSRARTRVVLYGTLAQKYGGLIR